MKANHKLASLQQSQVQKYTQSSTPHTFFNLLTSYEAYQALPAEFKEDSEVNFWAYRLMPNHVHLVAAPNREDSLARLFRRVHRLYSVRINQREKWTGIYGRALPFLCHGREASSCNDTLR
jgi:REP element-mobilizing transposase RayT